MKELRQKKKDLNITEDEWNVVWMLTMVKKRKRIDRFIQQALRDVVKLGGDIVVKNFEDKFKELRVEGCRKDGGSSSLVMFTEDGEEMDEEDEEDLEDLPDDYYDDAEMEEIDTMFMGTESEVRRQFQKNGPYRPRIFPKKPLSWYSRHDGYRRQQSQ